MKVHVHIHVFSSIIKENSSYPEKNFHIIMRREEVFSLTDFLGCKSTETYQDSKSFKGIHIRSNGNELIFYIFQNDYYFKINSDETGFPNHKNGE